MTLMPVSNICARGSRASKGGASRWISHRSSTAPMSAVSRDSPRTLKTCPSTTLPTGTVSPRPRLRTAVPRCRPSVGLRHTQRTRPSPICWATSAVTVTVWPSSSRSISTAMFSSGREWGGNSTSTTGPAMATTRPSASSAPDRGAASTVVVMGCSVSCSRYLWRAVRGGPGSFAVGRLAQGLGTTDDLHDLGGDGVLAGPVHDSRQRLHELVGVVGGGGHGPLAGGVLAGRRLEEGAEHGRLGIAGHEIGEEVGGGRLELGVALALTSLAGAGRSTGSAERGARARSLALVSR